MALLTQVGLLKQADDLQIAAGRSLQQFKNSFDSVIADLATFEAAVAQAGFDAGTLAEIDGIKSALLADAITEVSARLTQLQNLQGG